MMSHLYLRAGMWRFLNAGLVGFVVVVVYTRVLVGDGAIVVLSVVESPEIGFDVVVLTAVADSVGITLETSTLTSFYELGMFRLRGKVSCWIVSQNKCV